MKSIGLLLQSCGLFLIVLWKNVEALEAESILGGDAAVASQFPYQVSVENLEFSICGGAIVGSRHVVTAAHCVIDEDNRFIDYPLKVVAGVGYLTSQARSRVEVSVDRIYALKLFSRKTKTLPGDIAVLRLVQALPLEGNIFLKALRKPLDWSYVGEKAVVSGYGSNWVKLGRDPQTQRRKEVDLFTTGQLRFADACVLSKDQCQRQYFASITDYHICAQVKQRKPDTPEGVCSGDSGSPLVYNNDQLIGILSASPIGCNEKDAAGIYTRVSYFVKFINNAMADKVANDMRSSRLKIA